MKNKLITIIGIIYVILAIFVTKFLLDRNDFGVFETKDNYYAYNTAISECGKTSLVSFPKVSDYGNFLNEEVYYFADDNILKKGVVVSYSPEENTFTVQNDSYSVNNLLGKPEKGYLLLGVLLCFLTTRFVYLVLIIIPVFILLVYEVYLLFVYLKKGKTRKDLKDETIKENKE